MHPDHFRDMIVRAAADDNRELLNRIAQQLADAARAHGILRAKGYGHSGLTIDAAAAQVPHAEFPQ